MTLNYVPVKINSNFRYENINSILFSVPQECSTSEKPETRIMTRESNTDNKVRLAGQLINDTSHHKVKPEAYYNLTFTQDLFMVLRSLLVMPEVLERVRIFQS